MQNDARKLKEVWRNSDGSFAKAPVEVAPETKEKKEDGSVLVALVMLVVAVATAATVFWQITLAVGVFAGAGYGVRKIQTREKLTINYY